MIVIDPGHGGHNQAGKSTPFGARGPDGGVEKDINLALAQRVAAHLGGQAVLTRDSDTNVSLGERTAAAHRLGARAFVSIHASEATAGGGSVDTWIHRESGPGSRELALRLQDSLARFGAGGVRLGDLAVLHPAALPEETPACMIDLGLLGGRAGEHPLRDPELLDGMARSIAEALRAASHTAFGRRAYGTPLVHITHAGTFRLAYDRLSHYGVIEPEPGRTTRRFRGQQSLQDALNAWGGDLARAVASPPAYVLTGGLYVNKPGKHGEGLAIDVDGLWWSDSNVFLANNAPTSWDQYLRIEASLRRHFGTVLNYDYNSDHHDHWHCDLGGATTWRHVRSQNLFVQRALNVIWGENLDVDGDFGDLSRAALGRAGYDFSTNAGWDRFLDNILFQRSTVP
ncbi:MAG: N-acetylmuramoyl-L-alanine amidase [Pseudomonadota bacterium]